MGVVAKFRCNEVTNRAPIVEYAGRDGETRHGPVVTHAAGGSRKEEIKEAQATVRLNAVYASESDPEASPEDIAFSLATPSGQIELTITNPDALEEFQPGTQYLVRFEKIG